MSKAIINIKYNHLNQPTEVDFGYFDKLSKQKTKYIYTATGLKLQTKIFKKDKLKSKTDYSGAFVYENDKLAYTNIAGGRIIAKTGKYQYDLTDHLGNTRVTFAKDEATGGAKIIQSLCWTCFSKDHYYPFGMRISGQHYDNTQLLNKYLYNGKEQQDQTNYYDYGFRQLDAQLGRWHVVDAMAESYFSISPYSYTNNDPINHIDILGLTPTRGYGPGLFDSYNARKIFEADGGGGASFDVWASGSGFGLGNTFGGRGLGSAGPSGADWDEWKAQGGKGNFIEWYKKRFDAAWKEGYASIEAAKTDGFTFSKRLVKKWRRKTETLTVNYYEGEEGDVQLKEVIVIWEAYWEEEVYLEDVETYSNSGLNYYYKGYKLSSDDAEKFLKNWSKALNNNGYSAATTGGLSAIAINEYGSKLVGRSSILNGFIISSEFFIKADLLNEVNNNYDNSGLSIETWTTWHGTFAFPTTVTYLKRNSDKKMIGILWH